MIKRLDSKKYYIIDGIKYVSLEKGKRLFSEGDPGNDMYVIVKGEVKVCLNRNNREILLDVMKKGQFLGEMSLLEGEPRSASVVALKNTELMIIDHSSIMYSLRKYPELAVKLLKVLSNRLRKSNAVISSLNVKLMETEELCDTLKNKGRT